MTLPWSWPPPQPVPPDAVLSVFGRTGAVVAQTDDYAASEILNDSAVGGAQVSDALNLLLASVLAAANYAGSNPYLAVPAAPNAFDDEFLSGSADLATRGYTVVNAATGVVQTRSGGIDPWSAAGPAAGTYWSTLANSWLYIQAPAGIQLDIYKAITLAAGDTYFARSVGSYNFATAAVGRLNDCGFYGASGAQLDGNNCVYSQILNDPSVFYTQANVGRVTAGAFSGAGNRLTLTGHDIRGVFFDSGTTHTPFWLDSQNGEPAALQVTGTPAAATLTRFALRNAFSASGTAVPQIWSIDFIRKKTGRAWLIP